nr:MAG TPA: hypothetical protein [Caudoviricetes sp.]
MGFLIHHHFHKSRHYLRLYSNVLNQLYLHCKNHELFHILHIFSLSGMLLQICQSQVNI